jgi:hypothetical protein
MVLAQNSKDLILVINDVRYYESVASLNSFLRSSKINLFIDTSELKGSGMLESQLRLASQIGELKWGVRGRSIRKIGANCLAVTFESSQKSRECKKQILLGWFK